MICSRRSSLLRQCRSGPIHRRVQLCWPRFASLQLSTKSQALGTTPRDQQPARAARLADFDLGSSDSFSSVGSEPGSSSSSSSSTSYVSSSPPPLPASSSSTGYDDDLRAHFDTPTSHASVAPASSSSGSGLFAYGPLTHPTALRRLTDRTLVHSAALVDRISNAASDASGREVRLVVKNLDRLSDLLCGVIDMCELVRNAHPEREWVEESDRAYERLASFMNGLNTHQGLYNALLATLNHQHAEPMSHAETQVALTFLRDFERSGIQLPPDIRARFVELSDSLLSVGRTFLNNASSPPSPHPPIEIPEADRLLAGMGSQFIDSLRRGRGRRNDAVYVAPGSWEAQMIARYAREGEARRLVYVGNMRAEADRVAVLEQMLRERAELADVLGKESWADVVLSDKMAKSPSNVMGFLDSLAEHHRPAAAADVATLQRLKATSLTGNTFAPEMTTGHLPPLSAWDRDFYSERYQQSLDSSSLPSISPYFSTGNALLGLSRLFSKLYGISFRPASVAPGEVWHPSVRRIDVVDEVEGPIGVIYCDLFSREGKPPSAAHYTVRCSRRVDDDDLAGDGLSVGWDEQYGPGLEQEGSTIRGKQGKFQLPIVVLTTDFGSVEPGRPALLGWNDVETLFHEMGHAIHSMIGRTEYHNVSGTRCATDFVELPSILMEHFVSSPSVLSLFATHYATQQPLPMPLIEAHLNQQRSMAALETHGQILMALLDQKYHSLRLSDLPTFDSTETYTQLQRQVGVIPPVEGTAWQTQFGHLYGYGATYYSYLFDRAIAGKVWKTLFNHTPEGSLSREGGEQFKEKVLKWGGGRDPWEMVGDVVGGTEGEQVAQGDERAMGLVGGWLIK